MTTVRTRRSMGIAIVLLSSVVFALGAATLKGAWKVVAHSVSQGGCACAAGAITAQDGLLLGLAALFAVGIMVGMIYMIITLVRTRLLVRRVLSRARVRDRLVVFSGTHCEAFTFGFMRPKIALCVHCLRNLPALELDAIVRHEAHHVARRDPLKLFLLTAFSYTLFFVPLIRNLVSLYRTAVEIEADERVDNREALGRVLLRITSQAHTGATASFASALTSRIERIVQPGWRMRVGLSPGPLFFSLALFSVISIAGLTQPGAAPPAVQCLKAMQCAASFDHVPAVYYTGSL